jgi:hypothetical protein
VTDRSSYRFVREDVQLESGGVLRAGQQVKLFGESGDFVGIEWRDSEGNHSMALRRDKLRNE